MVVIPLPFAGRRPASGSASGSFAGVFRVVLKVMSLLSSSASGQFIYLFSRQIISLGRGSLSTKTGGCGRELTHPGWK